MNMSERTHFFGSFSICSLTVIVLPRGHPLPTHTPSICPLFIPSIHFFASSSELNSIIALPEDRCVWGRYWMETSFTLPKHPKISFRWSSLTFLSLRNPSQRKRREIPNYDLRACDRAVRGSSPMTTIESTYSLFSCRSTLWLLLLVLIDHTVDRNEVPWLLLRRDRSTT